MTKRELSAAMAAAGSLGGKARAQALTPARRLEISRRATIASIMARRKKNAENKS